MVGAAGEATVGADSISPALDDRMPRRQRLRHPHPHRFPRLGDVRLRRHDREDRRPRLGPGGGPDGTTKGLRSPVRSRMPDDRALFAGVPNTICPPFHVRTGGGRDWRDAIRGPARDDPR